MWGLTSGSRIRSMLTEYEAAILVTKPQLYITSRKNIGNEKNGVGMA